MRNFTKEQTQMVNKHLKRRLTLLAIWEMQIRALMNQHFRSNSWKMKSADTKAVKNTEQGKHSWNALGNGLCRTTFKKNWQYLVSLRMDKLITHHLNS